MKFILRSVSFRQTQRGSFKQFWWLDTTTTGVPSMGTFSRPTICSLRKYSHEFTYCKYVLKVLSSRECSLGFLIFGILFLFYLANILI